MTPILLEPNSFKLDDRIGFLVDTLKAVVTEERNGKYEMSFQYPITGQWFDNITDGSVIMVKPNDTAAALQAFRVFKISRPIKGIVTYSCQHISYDLGGFPLAGFTAQDLTPAQAIQKALSEASLAQWFMAQTDITSTNSTTIEGPCTVRGLLGGMRGSILDVWGGEYEFNNRMIILHQSRGSDNGVTIVYGKNMTSLQQESNISDTYTHVMPYASYTVEGSDEPNYVFLPEKVLSLGIGGSPATGANRALIMDFSDKFGDNVTPTVAQLRSKAQTWATGTGYGYTFPKTNIKVSFLPLWQTEEYKNIAPLERVSLCDVVTVKYPALGVNMKTKVIKTVYNALTEKYESITLGDMKESFASMYSSQVSAMQEIRASFERPIIFLDDPN